MGICDIFVTAFWALYNSFFYNILHYPIESELLLIHNTTEQFTSWGGGPNSPPDLSDTTTVFPTRSQEATPLIILDIPENTTTHLHPVSLVLTKRGEVQPLITYITEILTSLACILLVVHIVRTVYKMSSNAQKHREATHHRRSSSRHRSQSRESSASSVHSFGSARSSQTLRDRHLIDCSSYSRLHYCHRGLRCMERHDYRIFNTTEDLPSAVDSLAGAIHDIAVEVQFIKALLISEKNLSSGKADHYKRAARREVSRGNYRAVTQHTRRMQALGENNTRQSRFVTPTGIPEDPYRWEGETPLVHLPSSLTSTGDYRQHQVIPPSQQVSSYPQFPPSTHLLSGPDLRASAPTFTPITSYGFPTSYRLPPMSISPLPQDNTRPTPESPQ